MRFDEAHHRPHAARLDLQVISIGNGPRGEEIIYIISGQAEQWCGNEYKVLKPGEMVLIPKGEVHGTYNPYREPVVFLAILAPANAPGPDVVDVSTEAPWSGRRESLGLGPCAPGLPL